MKLWELVKRKTGEAAGSDRLSPTRPGAGEFDSVAPYYDHLMAQIPYVQWVDYVEVLLDRHRIKANKVLDLACGTGSVGREMLRRGYRVWGVDLSEPMVRRCTATAPPMPAAVMDAGQLGIKAESLELVVCLYDSLNYILEPAGLQCCFDRVCEALRPGAALVFDLNTPRALQIGLFTQGNLRTPDPLQYSWKAHWDEATGLCRVDMWFQWHGDGEPVEFTEIHYQRAYPDHQVRAMLAQAGFPKVTAYHAYTERPPTRWSDRIYYVACKE